MSSKMVSNLRKLGVLVTSTTSDRSRNDRVMRSLLERCADVAPEGTTTATIEEAQFFLGQQIAFETEALRLWDDSHVGQLADIDGERRVRNDALTETYDVLLRTRQAFETVHGPGSGITLLGLDTTVPDDPDRLLQVADRCRRWLLDPGRIFPEPRLKAFSFDRQQAVADLEGPLERLQQALRTLPEELRSSIDTLAAKFRAMQKLDKLIGQAARFTEALYDVAGLEFESERLRPTSHRAANAGSQNSIGGNGENASPPADGDQTPAPENGSSEEGSSASEDSGSESPNADSPTDEAPADDTSADGTPPERRQPEA